MNRSAEEKAGKKRHLLYWAAGILLLMLILFGGSCFALTPYAIREIWLPFIARSAGITLKADEIRLESLRPFRLKTVNFHYADPEISLKIRTASSDLRTDGLKRHRIELHNTQIEGIRIVSRPPTRSEKTSAGGTPSPQSGGEEKVQWSFAMGKYQVKDAVLEIKNGEQKTVQVWSASTLHGDRFQTGIQCHLSADASVITFPSLRTPVQIRKLPFRLQADYQMDRDLRLQQYSCEIETEVFDLSITDEIDIPAKAGIRASAIMQGRFPKPDTLQMTRSEIRLFKDGKNIGNLQLQGMFGSSFQCSGTCTDLDLEPYLSILSPTSQVRTEVPRAEFHITGSDFSAAALSKDLKIRLIAELKDLSIPISLNRESRILRLVLIPVEAMPPLVELLEMKWRLKNHVNRCLNTVESIISGQQNLNFRQAKMDLSVEEGRLKISDFTLVGSDIEMESIQGYLDLGTEELNIRTVLIVRGIKLPLKFQGSLNQPKAYFKDALKDFMLMNTPLLDKMEKLLTEPVSEKDSKLEKAIKRGYRDLNRALR